MVKPRYKRLHPLGRLYAMMGLGLVLGSLAPTGPVEAITGIFFVALGLLVQKYIKP